MCAVHALMYLVQNYLSILQSIISARLIKKFYDKLIQISLFVNISPLQKLLHMVCPYTVQYNSFQHTLYSYILVFHWQTQSDCAFCIL